MFTCTSISANGQVLQTVSGQDEDKVSASVHPDATHTTNIAPESMDDSYWDFSLGAWGLRAPQPDKHSVFDWTTKQWADPRTLQDLKAAKWAAIRTARDTLEATSFPYLGRHVQSDIVSVLRINTAVKAADYAQAQGAPFATQWRCADNALLDLDGPAMQMMPVALAAYSQSLHTRANTLRTQIEAAQNEADLDLITW